MNYQVALDQIEARRAELDRERQGIIDIVVGASKCAGCHWMSNPKYATIPTCRDIDNVNYSRRIPHVTTCKSHYALHQRRAKVTT